MTHRLGTAAFVTGLLLAGIVPGISAQESSDQLQLAIVVPVSSGPLFTADGRPAGDAADRLTSIGDALDALTRPELAELPFALAVSPLFCDETVRFGGPLAGRVTTLLRQLSSRLPVLGAPYADVRLPDLGSPRAVARELAAGRTTLGSCAGVQPVDIVFPPDLVIDAGVLDGVVDGGATAALAPADRFPGDPVRFGDLTFVPALTIPPGAAPNDALITFGARTAAAALLDPVRPDLTTFLIALANDPRIALRTLSDLTGEPAPQSVTLPTAPAPPDAYLSSVAGARRALARFRSYTLPDNRLAAILTTAVGRARSSAEWDGRWSVGRRRAATVTATVMRQQELVSAAQGSVTFTSRRGSVPVTVTNDATYPVRVRVSLQSSKLAFPDGAARVVTVDPPGDTTVFGALARSTGAFPVQVRVTSPEQSIVFHSGELTVRSTAANLPALILTAGGALFLAGWSLRQVRRRRHGA